MIPKLSALAPPAQKQSADLIYQRRVSSPRTYLRNHGIMIVVHLDHLRAPLYHLLIWFLARAALSVLVVPPRVHLPIAHQCHRVRAPACHLLHDERLLRDGRLFLN
jgi:hypothetical protein